MVWEKENMSNQSFKIVVNGGEPVVCVSGQTIVQAAPHIAPKGCKEGGCTRCKVLVTSGKVQLGEPSVAALNPDDKAEGYILACQTTPLSDLEIKQNQQK